MEIQDKCFDYLKSVNPIAQKIADDIIGVKENNIESWNSLDYKAQNKIIDEALIDNGLEEKYECAFETEYGDNQTSNFSWFTRSQLNLFTLLNVKPERNKTPLKKIAVLSPQKKTKIVLTKVSESAKKNTKNKSSRDEKSEKICMKGVAKPKTPPPPPPAKLVLMEQRGLLDNNQAGDDIPKTGFDFLDNW